MASTTNKPFHTYENVGYEDQVMSHYATPAVIPNTTITTTASVSTNSGNISGVAINKAAIELPFSDPSHGK